MDKRMNNKVITLTDEQMSELEEQLCQIAYDCGMDEDDNAKYTHDEIELSDGLIIFINYWIMCVCSWYTPSSYDYPADGGGTINIDIREASTYLEDVDGDVEVVLPKTDFDFEF